MVRSEVHGIHIITRFAFNPPLKFELLVGDIVFCGKFLYSMAK